MKIWPGEFLTEVLKNIKIPEGYKETENAAIEAHTKIESKDRVDTCSKKGFFTISYVRNKASIPELKSGNKLQERHANIETVFRLPKGPSIADAQAVIDREHRIAFACKVLIETVCIMVVIHIVPTK